MADDPMKLEDPLWSISNDSVRGLFDAPPRLEVHTVHAENANGRTVAVSVGYGVGPDLDELYGSAMAAVVVVAVNLTSGRIYQRRIASAEALPLSYSLPDEPPNEPEVDEDGENVAAERIGFDLARYLGVPLDGQRYALFAWLDRLVSNTAIVEMPRVVGTAPFVSLPSGEGASTIQMVHAAAVSERSRGDPLMFTSLATGAGPFVVLGLDGFTRAVSSVSLLEPEPGPVGINLTAFAGALAQSHHPSWVCVFNGEVALAPHRISR